jgi:hypothetical protein
MTTQERIAAFPAAVLVDFEAAGMCGTTASRYGVVTPGERGYQPLWTTFSFDKLEAMVCRHHNCRAATYNELSAALAGSMFGWDVPAADPFHSSNTRAP